MRKTEATFDGQRPTSKKIGADISDEELAERAMQEKLTDTSRLGSYKPKTLKAETDPDKMSPLLRAAHEAAEKRKRRRVTTDDAAAALGSRR